MTEIDFNAELVLREEQGPSPIADRLIRALADEYSVQFYSQVAHWNVTGPDFQQLHALFEESYTVCNESVDVVADQARILGGRSSPRRCRRSWLPRRPLWQHPRTLPQRTWSSSSAATRC